VPDIVWIILMVAILTGITVIALRLEPHWSSKDGLRFICRAQVLDARLQSVGRWREVRGEIKGDDIVVRTRSLISRHAAGTWHVQAKGTVDGRKRHVYLLRSDGTDQQLALRIPANSNTQPLLEELLPR
jgi:hypothetical protein